MMADLRAISGKQVLCDDHAAPYAANRTILKQLLCKPSDDNDMALLELTHTASVQDEINVCFIHQLIADSHVRVLTESHGFAALVPVDI